MTYISMLLVTKQSTSNLSRVKFWICFVTSSKMAQRRFEQDGGNHTLPTISLICKSRVIYRLLDFPSLALWPEYDKRGNDVPCRSTIAQYLQSTGS